jgi:hypothetical protein
VTKTPSAEYIQAAKDVQAWIAEQIKCNQARARQEHRPIMGFRKERTNDFFPPTFSQCPKCGDEYEPGSEHECRGE